MISKAANPFSFIRFKNISFVNALKFCLDTIIIILNRFGYKDLTENEIKEQYQARFDEEEENPDIEPDYNAKTAQERSEEQREIYRTLK